MASSSDLHLDLQWTPHPSGNCGVLGLAFSFYEDALEVKVKEPDFQLKIMLVAGYGHYEAYPISRVLGVLLSDLWVFFGVVK